MGSILRIGLNALYLRPGHVGGSETYVRALCGAFDSMADVELTVLCHTSAASSFSFAGGSRVVGLGVGEFRQSKRLWTENVKLRQHIGGVDVLFSPANFGVPLLASLIPQIVTVHDLQHAALPEYFSWVTRLMREALFRSTFVRARRLIAISEFTKADIVARYGVDQDKISTVLEGVTQGLVCTPEQAEQAKARHGLDRYFIYPAMSAPHKNHIMLIRAFADFCRSTPGYRLVFSGQETEHYAAIKAVIRDERLDDVVDHLGYVSRQELLSLIAGARALVFPSLFEGFGLPTLEAMQLGVPVLSSDQGALPEVVGDAGIQLAADDPRAWSEAMRSVTEDHALVVELIERGRKNATRFTWQKCARETSAVLASALA